MKKLIKKTEHRLDSVKAFGGTKCITDCSSCTCNCTSTSAKRATEANTRTAAQYMTYVTLQ